MLPKAHRLTRSDDYARVRRGGQSKAHPLLILATAPNGGELTRVGIAVGKKVGKAVVRNRIKRRLRETARSRLRRLRPGQDIVLIARRDLATVAQSDLDAALDQLLRRAGLFAKSNCD